MEEPQFPLAVFMARDERELYTYTHASRMRSAFDAVDNKLRSWLKYGHTFKTPEEVMESVRSLLLENKQDAQEGPE